MPIDRKKYAVPNEQLRRVCKPVELSSEELDNQGLGQHAALSSMDIGLQMADDEYAQRHYNIVVVGSPKTGRTKQAIKYVTQWAEQQDCEPPDAVSVHDFDSPRRFIVARVANGCGEELVELMGEFALWTINELQNIMVAFQNHQTADMSVERDQAMAQVVEVASKHQCIVLQDKHGNLKIEALSLRDSTKPMEDEELRQLDPDVAQEIDQHFEAAIEEVSQIMNPIMDDHSERLEQIKKTCIAEAKRLCEEKLQSVRQLTDHSEDFERFLHGLIKRISYLKAKPPQEPQAGGMFGPGEDQKADMAILQLCKVSVLVNNEGRKHPPVLYVDKPRFTRMFGCPHGENVGNNNVHMDHTMVEGGAMLEAHGGYLVFDMRSLIRLGRDPALTKLLEVLRTGKMSIETMTAYLDLETMFDYRSCEIPIDVRVVVICNPFLEMVLRHYEPDFDNLFRVVSEFRRNLPVDEAQEVYSRFVDICSEQDELPKFNPNAKAKLVEYGSRRSGDQGKASVELGFLKDAIRQSAYWARQAGAKSVSAKHVRQAFQEQFESRALRVRAYQEFVDRGHMLLTLNGWRVGQINGLVVFQMPGDMMFGMPKRLTARDYAGNNGVLLVQRATKQSGPLSNTAIEEIIGYLNGKYGREQAISRTVQLSFEQTYGGVDGDSATVAEYVAVISAITDLPIDQRGVITGSMNQLGEVQPIGGVNEKVESHFHLLKRLKKLRSHHFAVVPKLNVEQFMLDEDLVRAHKHGRYQIYAITHVDQALEIFLGKPIREIDRLVKKKLARAAKSKGKK